jgi:hypothetical protein
MNVRDIFVTQSLQFRHMTRRASRFIERPIYEHNHSEEAAAQRNTRHDGQDDRQASIQAIIGSEVIPPVKPELFRERKELGICDRSAAFRHRRSDFCVAGFRSRGCAEAISAAHRKLSAFPFFEILSWAVLMQARKKPLIFFCRCARKKISFPLS